jgi:hypothetical protein
MNISSTYTLIMILIISLSTSVLIIHYLIDIRKHSRLESSRGHKNVYDEKNKEGLTLKPENILDPLEEKLLFAIILPKNRKGLSVDQFNELLNLTDLTTSNQRQRRHIIVKELNLKLYLITGLRESIIRSSIDTDKRVKYYTLEFQNVEKIKKIADILLKKQYLT